MCLDPEKQLMIADGGQVHHLTYPGLLEFHQGDSWFGLSVGFRAMQLAGFVLSDKRLWDRQNLLVESGHPGPGMRDAIEYVTRCVSRKRFHLAVPETAIKCSREMRFEWQVSDGRQTVEVRLRPGFVPGAFFNLLDRRDTEQELAEDRRRFDDFKRELSERLWQAPLEAAFDVNESGIKATSHACSRSYSNV